MISILIVDDQKEVRDEIIDIFEDMNKNIYEIHQADNAESAIKQIKKQEPYIVILDILMPGSDGFSVIEYIKSSNRKCKIIIMTAFPELNYALKAINNKVESFLVKPIAVEQLQTAVLDIIKSDEFLKQQQKILRQHNHLYYRMLDVYMTSIDNDLDFEKISINTGLHDISSSKKLILIIRPNNVKDINEKFEHLSSSFLKKGIQNIYYVHDLSEFVFIIGVEQERSLLKDIDSIISSLVKNFSAGIAIGDSNLGIKTLYSRAQFALSYANDADITGKCIIYNELNIAHIIISKHWDEMFDFYKSKQLQKFEEAVDSLFVELMQNRVEAERACRMLEKTWRQAYIELTSLSNCKSLNSLHAQMMKELSGRLDAKEDDILPDKIQNILDFVKDKYQQQINLAYVSNHFNMGYSYTSTLFKKHTGMSFTQYLTKFRMDKALELLENTNCYVYEIANKVGFSDNTYFYKLFKEKYGVTPREYYQNMCHGNSNV